MPVTSCSERLSANLQRLFNQSSSHEELQRSPLWSRIQLAYELVRGEKEWAGLHVKLCDQCPWVKVRANL